MKIGTKSLLFGCHQFILHPLFTFMAWVRLYGVPTVRELIAIVIHDWGYFGCRTMEGVDGNAHPIWASNLFKRIGRSKEADLALYHSRFFAKRNGSLPSKLCYADKLGTALMPCLLWIILAKASGELKEYMAAEHFEVHGDFPPMEFIKRYSGVVKMLLLKEEAGTECNKFALKWRKSVKPFKLGINNES